MYCEYIDRQCKGVAMESTKRVAKLCLVDGGMQSHRDAGMQYDVIDR